MAVKEEMKRAIASMVAVPFAAAAMLPACRAPEATVAGPGGVELKREETFIPFANQRSAIVRWQADGRDGLWIESGLGQWYYARFMNPCIGIENAVRLGFDTGTSGQLDRFSYIIVPNERERCAIASFTNSDPPPAGDRREHRD